MSALQAATQEVQAHLARLRGALGAADAPALTQAMATLPRQLGRLRDAWAAAQAAERAPARPTVHGLATEVHALREAVARAQAGTSRGLATLLPDWRAAPALYDAGGAGLRQRGGTGQLQA